MQSEPRRPGWSGYRLFVLAFVVTSVAACAGDDAPPSGASNTGNNSTTTVSVNDPTTATSAPWLGTDSNTTVSTGSTVRTVNTVEPGSPTRVTLPDDSGLEPQTGGTFRFALIAEIDGLNPTSSALTVSSGVNMANAVYDTLAAYGADGAAVPYLAESFTPSDDFMSWDVRLRPNVQFHDGTPLDAAAVQLNFESQRNNGLVGLAVRPFYPDTNATEVLDGLTIRFNLLEPNRYWPQTMATQLGMMASPTWITAALADPTLNQRPVGTGPFVFDTRSEDSITRFVRNDKWWNGSAFLDAIEFVPVPDAATRGDFLIEGEVDGLQTTEPASIVELRADPNLNVLLDDSGVETFIQVNTAAPPFDDLRARQAIAWATPREDLLTLIALGTSRPANGRFVPESPFANPSIVQVTDDPARAVELATSYCSDFPANCTDGKIDMEYQWPGPDVVNTRIADLMIAGWGAAFNISRDELLQDEHVQQTALGQYNANLWQAFSAVDPISDTVWLSCRTVGVISLNFPKFCSPALDAALLAAAIAQDPIERADLYQETERILNESFARVYLTHALTAIALSNEVHGVCNRTSPEGVELLCSNGNVIWHDTTWIG